MHFIILSGKRSLKLPLTMDATKSLQITIKVKLDTHVLNAPISSCCLFSLSYGAREQKSI